MILSYWQYNLYNHLVFPLIENRYPKILHSRGTSRLTSWEFSSSDVCLKKLPVLRKYFSQIKLNLGSLKLLEGILRIICVTLLDTQHPPTYTPPPSHWI